MGYHDLYSRDKWYPTRRSRVGYHLAETVEIVISNGSIWDKCVILYQVSFPQLGVFHQPKVSFHLQIPYMSSLRYDELNNICEEGWTRTDSQLYTVLTSVFTYFIPLFVITICYSTIIIEVTTSRYKRQSTSFLSADRLQVIENRNLMKLVLVINLSFALCSLPYHVVWLLYEFTDIKYTYVNFSDIVTVSYLLFYLNSALNPINYNVFSTSFRSSSLDLYRKLGRQVPFTWCRQETISIPRVPSVLSANEV